MAVVLYNCLHSSQSILVVAILMWLLFYTTVNIVAKSILVVAILMWLLFYTTVYIVVKSILVIAILLVFTTLVLLSE